MDNASARKFDAEKVWPDWLGRVRTQSTQARVGKGSGGLASRIQAGSERVVVPML